MSILRNGRVALSILGVNYHSGQYSQRVWSGWGTGRSVGESLSTETGCHRSIWAPKQAGSFQRVGLSGATLSRGRLNGQQEADLFGPVVCLE